MTTPAPLPPRPTSPPALHRPRPQHSPQGAAPPLWLQLVIGRTLGALLLLGGVALVLVVVQAVLPGEIPFATDISSAGRGGLVQEIGSAAGSTLLLVLTAVLLAVAFHALWLTLTVKGGPWLHRIGEAVDESAAGIPPHAFAVFLRGFSAGAGAAVIGTSGLGMLLAAAALFVPLAGFMSRSVRGEMRARADGPGKLRRSIAAALLTRSGWALGATLSGVLVVELIFARPGLGQLALQALFRYDMTLMSCAVSALILLYVIGVLVCDLLVLLLDRKAAPA